MITDTIPPVIYPTLTREIGMRSEAEFVKKIENLPSDCPVLDLSYNSLYKAKFSLLSAIFSAIPDSVQKLILDYNSLSLMADEHSFIAAFSSLPEPIRHVSLKANGFASWSAERLNHLLTVLPDRIEFDLSGNRFTHAQCTAIAQAGRSVFLDRASAASVNKVFRAETLLLFRQLNAQSKRVIPKGVDQLICEFALPATGVGIDYASMINEALRPNKKRLS